VRSAVVEVVEPSGRTALVVVAVRSLIVELISPSDTIGLVVV